MTTDRVLSISSVVIALTAVCVSIWQGVVAREHNNLSVKPYITAAPRLPGVGGENGVFISNAGVGPAFIKKAFIKANGKEFDMAVNNWPAVYTHLNLKRLCYVERWFKEGATLKAGQDVKLIAPTTSPLDASCPVEFIKLISAPELTLSIEYESIYGEEFKYSQRIGLDDQEISRFKKELGY
ncbi:hypothetical protein CGI93_22450 [Vibrio parahaemolyticus]|uniref:hypothetical protein n=1 Tax=Vibrio parahaemolyticus TaxID=670 RepID=UPI00111C994B|nr:hypothetical protein [Vibrio parahaemolyticus]TOG81133.1 hypothetical protein CGI93_22450 [Vibrio parahaemolyticus]HCK0617601.1 hypothetical protein [Vibrio parahaemolyticus]